MTRENTHYKNASNCNRPTTDVRNPFESKHNALLSKTKSFRKLCEFLYQPSVTRATINAVLKDTGQS